MESVGIHPEQALRKGVSFRNECESTGAGAARDQRMESMTLSLENEKKES